jgi:hypothetical protein
MNAPPKFFPLFSLPARRLHGPLCALLVFFISSFCIELVRAEVCADAYNKRVAEINKRGPQFSEETHERETIDNLIKVLEKEGLDESIDRLVRDDQQYYHPGYNSDTKFAQLCLEVMLSARRSIKVLQSLKNLPVQQQEMKSKEVFARAFQLHTNTFRIILERRANPSLPRNTQSTRATQLALCVAMFAAADLGFKEVLAEEFTQLDSFKEQMKSRLPLMERYYVPDNRFQVNVLYLLASRISSESTQLLGAVDEECIRANMRKNEIPIVTWNARTTWFDRVGSAMDTNNGVTRYVAYDWKPSDLVIHEENQLTVLSNLRKLVLR